MVFGFDDYGWFTGEVPNGTYRSTPLVPPAAQGNMRPNFTGHQWLLLEFREPPAPEAQPRIIPVDQFRDRFTVSEMDAVLAAAYGSDVECRRLLFMLQTANGEVHLDSATVQQGMAYLVGIAVLTSARAAEILG